PVTTSSRRFPNRVPGARVTRPTILTTPMPPALAPMARSTAGVVAAERRRALGGESAMSATLRTPPCGEPGEQTCELPVNYQGFVHRRAGCLGPGAAGRSSDLILRLLAVEVVPPTSDQAGGIDLDDGGPVHLDSGAVAGGVRAGRRVGGPTDPLEHGPV